MNNRLGCLISSFILISFTSIQAQRLPPIIIRPYKPGVYRTFNEFVMNKPSIRENFEIIPRSGDRKIEKGKGDYDLVVHDSAYRKKDLQKFWGASDGVSVFVNEYMYGRGFNLKKIHGVGRYCYFKGSPNIASIVMMPGGPVSASLILAADIEDTYILNINNGRFFVLTKPVLTAILKKDPELLKEYEEESRKGSTVVLVDYIQKYNTRHADEADLDKMIQVVIYRRSKKGE